MDVGRAALLCPAAVGPRLGRPWMSVTACIVGVMTPTARRHKGLTEGQETGHAAHGGGVRMLLEVWFTRRAMGTPMRFQDRPQHLKQELYEPTVEAAEDAARRILHGLEHPPNGAIGPATIRSWNLELLDELDAKADLEVLRQARAQDDGTRIPLHEFDPSRDV